MKICINCGLEKDNLLFYRHSKMADGRLNKCIDCCKMQAIERSRILTKDKDWIEKERARGREKYKRLNYKERSLDLAKDKPWKKYTKYKNLSRRFKVDKGFELHHWCYKKESIEDVVIMDIRSHKRLHTFLILDVEKRIFKVKKTKVYLNTRELHLSFIKTSGFEYKTLT